MQRQSANIIYLHVAYIRWDRQVEDQARVARRLRLADITIKSISKFAEIGGNDDRKKDRMVLFNSFICPDIICAFLYNLDTFELCNTFRRTQVKTLRLRPEEAGYR